MKVYKFRTVPLSIIRSFPLQDKDVPSWSCSLAVSKPVWHTTAVCTVENSWWWTEELSETCRVSFQNESFEKLVHIVGFTIRNLSRCTVTWTSNFNIRDFHIIKNSRQLCGINLYKSFYASYDVDFLSQEHELISFSGKKINSKSSVRFFMPASPYVSWKQRQNSSTNFANYVQTWWQILVHSTI